MKDSQQLIAAYLDGTLDPAQRAELTAWLRADAENLQQFTEAVRFEQQIRAVVQAKELRAGAEAFVVSAATASPINYWRWLALAACLAVLATFAAWLLQPRASIPGAASDWLAEVTMSRGAVQPGDAAWQTGQRLPSGRVALSAGAMELTLSNEVRVVLEGPGELELLTPMRVVLRSGQAVVRVPEGAKGFRLETAGAQVVDLGTEFGVKCGPGGVTDVLVFEGEVVASSATGSTGFPQQLTSGMATRFSPGQSQPASIAYRPERFVRRLPADHGIELKDQGRALNAPTVEEVAVFPAVLPMTVDGDLSDWSADGLFRSERRAKGYLDGRMRYDADYLYVAAHIGDPAPMRNVVAPATDGEFGWRGGGLQIRVATDPALGWPVNANAAQYYQFRGLKVDAMQVAQASNPALAHLTLWHYAPAAQNCLHIAYGMDFHGPLINPPGYRAAFRKDADGGGYTLEYAIPWRLLNAPRAPRAGETLAMSWLAHWSDESGRLWRGQWVEIRNLSEPIGINTWERAATWGRAVFK